MPNLVRALHNARGKAPNADFWPIVFYVVTIPNISRSAGPGNYGTIFQRSREMFPKTIPFSTKEFPDKMIPSFHQLDYGLVVLKTSIKFYLSYVLHLSHLPTPFKGISFSVCRSRYLNTRHPTTSVAPSHVAAAPAKPTGYLGVYQTVNCLGTEGLEP